MKKDNISKKAQVSSQVFIYIGAAVVAGLILIMGYKAIQTVITTFGQANIDDFKSDFENTVSVISKQSGSVKKFEFTLSKEYTEVCFVSSMNDQEAFGFDTSGIGNSFIRDSVDNNAKRNVFVLTGQNIEESFYVEDLNVAGNYKCLENKGLVTVWLSGKGRYAELEVRT
jgi:hypothetical protein